MLLRFNQLLEFENLPLSQNLSYLTNTNRIKLYILHTPLNLNEFLNKALLKTIIMLLYCNQRKLVLEETEVFSCLESRSVARDIQHIVCIQLTIMPAEKMAISENLSIHLYWMGGKNSKILREARNSLIIRREYHNPISTLLFIFIVNPRNTIMMLSTTQTLHLILFFLFLRLDIYL